MRETGKVNGVWHSMPAPRQSFEDAKFAIVLSPGPWRLLIFQRLHTMVLTGHSFINQNILVACDRKPTQISLSTTII